MVAELSGGLRQLAPTWAPYAAAMVEQLAVAGLVPDERWRNALQQVPRHHFVSRYYAHAANTPGGWSECAPDPTIETSHWYRRVYRDRALVTDLTGVGLWGSPRAAAVNPAPSALLRAFDALDISHGSRVLELGTGSGWTAGLLASQVGSDQVTSVEIDVELHERAAARLQDRGLAPTLLLGDSTSPALAATLRAGADFDRILVAHTLDHIPTAWLQFIRPGARLLVRIEGALGAGQHVLLTAQPHPTRRDETAALTGRFLPWSDPAPQRRVGAVLQQVHAVRPATSPSDSVSTTSLDPGLLRDNSPLLLLCQLLLPVGTTHVERRGPDERTVSTVATPTGAWTEITHHEITHRCLRAATSETNRTSATATAAGPATQYMTRSSGASRALVEALETAESIHRHHEQPGWSDFGLTVDDDGNRVWLHDPATGPSWKLQPEQPARRWR